MAKPARIWKQGELCYLRYHPDRVGTHPLDPRIGPPGPRRERQLRGTIALASPNGLSLAIRCQHTSHEPSVPDALIPISWNEEKNHYETLFGQGPFFVEERQAES